MPVGYPDYERLSRSGGYLLYGVANTTPLYDTILFSGYVGNWPYLTVALSINSTADFVQVIIAYYSDSTFATQVAFRYITRAGANFSVTQYANLTEWCQIWYISKSGNPINFLGFSVYATSDPAETDQLVSTDVPEGYYNVSMATGATQNILLGHVQPGPATLSISTQAAAWFAEVQYYDFGAGAYLLLTHIDNTIVASGGVFTVGLIDAPTQISMHNGDASSKFMRVSLVSI